MGALPIAGLMVLPLIYFSWAETLFYVMTLTLLWESPWPLPLGTVAIPLTAAVLLLQLLARHLLRGNPVGKVLVAVLLQSLVIFILESLWPPRSILGVFWQIGSIGAQLLCVALVSSMWIWAVVNIGKKNFNLDLEKRLKDL